MRKIFVFFLLIVFSANTFAYNPSLKDNRTLELVYKKIDVIYEKQPEKIEKLYTKISKVLPSLKKDNQTKYLITWLYNHIWNLINDYYEVISVIDWDTIKIVYEWKEQYIRMIWIDAPENSTTRYWYVELYWNEAKQKLIDLIWKNKIIIELDETQWTYDKYDRLLAYIFINWENINKKLIELWYWKEYTYNKPYKYQNEFKSAQEYAENNELWIWWELDYSENREVSEEKNYNFYTSSHYTSHLYYCETDSSWKGLSEKYLQVYDSEEELLNDSINIWKVLNKECE